MFQVLWNNVPITNVTAFVTLKKEPGVLLKARSCQAWKKGFFLSSWRVTAVCNSLIHRQPRLTSVGIFFCAASLSSVPLTCTFHRVSTVLKQILSCPNTIDKNEISVLHYSFWCTVTDHFLLISFPKQEPLSAMPWGPLLSGHRSCCWLEIKEGNQGRTVALSAACCPFWPLQIQNWNFNDFLSWVKSMKIFTTQGERVFWNLLFWKKKKEQRISVALVL